MHNVPREIDKMLKEVRHFIFTNKNTKEYVNYMLESGEMPREFAEEIKNNLLEKCGNPRFMEVFVNKDARIAIYIRISVWEGDFGTRIYVRELLDYVNICRR